MNNQAKVPKNGSADLDNAKTGLRKMKIQFPVR